MDGGLVCSSRKNGGRFSQVTMSFVQGSSGRSIEGPNKLKRKAAIAEENVTC